MSREQGDELGDAVVYHMELDGETVERRAYTPADEVNLQARGWVKSENKKAPAPRRSGVDSSQKDSGPAAGATS